MFVRWFHVLDSFIVRITPFELVRISNILYLYKRDCEEFSFRSCFYWRGYQEPVERLSMVWVESWLNKSHSLMAQVYNTSIKNIRKLLLQKICQVNKTLINAPALMWVLKKKVRQYNFLEKYKRWECDRVCMFNRHRCSRQSPYKTFWFTCFRRKTLVCCSSWWSEVKFLLWLWSCRS